MSDRRGLRLQKRRLCGDLNGLSGITDLENGVDAYGTLHLDLNRLTREALESFVRHQNPEVAGQQVDEGVVAAGIGLHRLLLVGAQVR
jgi:hypothetical protein